MSRRWQALVERAATRRMAKVANLTVVVLLASGSFIGFVALWFADRADPPTCYGIGWGCTPGPAATTALIGVVVLVPVFVGATILIWTGKHLAASSSGGWRHVGTVLVVLPVVVHLVAWVALIVATAVSMPGWVREIG